MNRVLLIPILIIAALSGCVEEELNALDLSTMMANSGKNLDSYRFVTETAMEFKSIEDSTEISMLIMRSRDSGAVNLTAQNMSAIISEVSSYGDEIYNTQQEVYIVGGAAKIKFNGNWSQASLQDAENFWALKNTAKQALLLNSSQLKLSGSEMIGGMECSRIEVMPDKKSYESFVFEQLESELPLAYVNLTGLRDRSVVNWTVWLSNDDGLPRKENVKMELSLTPDIMEQLSDPIEDFLLKIDLNITTLYLDYNHPLLITLPEGQRIEPIIECACNR
jgi:hypothetical protein